MSKSAVPVNLADKGAQFSELWSQNEVAVLNDYKVKLAKVNYPALKRRACTTGITGGDAGFASSPAPRCPGRGRGR